MKIVRSIILAVACLSLAACATLGGGVGPGADAKNELITAGAVAGEIAVRTRCPRNNVELGVLLGARTAFDLGVGAGLPVENFTRILAARDETNRVCGIVRVDDGGGGSPPPVS